MLIFGEDPLGCALNKVQVAGWLSVADFIIVQDYFMTETAKHADLILPASLPVEIGGSFTNTQKQIQEFNPEFESAADSSSIAQLSKLLVKLGLKQTDDVKDILQEALSLLSAKQDGKYCLEYTYKDNDNRMFNYGCDNIVKRFEEEFNKALLVK